MTFELQQKNASNLWKLTNMRSLVTKAAQGLWQASSLGMDKGERVVRYTMYKRIQESMQSIDPGPSVLSISHSSRLCGLLGAAPENILEANYPEMSIDKLNFPDEHFSCVVSDQVLEHISCDPRDATREVYRVLKPGGLAIHTTCFLTPYHGSSDYHDLDNGDFWRYTPSGLMRLHANYSEIITADGWGNPFMPIMGMLGVLRMRVPKAKWHPLNWLATKDRPSYAFVVWIIARK